MKVLVFLVFLMCFGCLEHRDGSENSSLFCFEQSGYCLNKGNWYKVCVEYVGEERYSYYQVGDNFYTDIVEMIENECN